MKAHNDFKHASCLFSQDGCSRQVSRLKKKTSCSSEYAQFAVAGPNLQTVPFFIWYLQ